MVFGGGVAVEEAADLTVGRTDGLFEGAIGIRVPGDGYVYAVDLARGLLILPEP